MEALEEDNRALRWRVGELEASVRMLLLYMNNRDDDHDAPRARRRHGCQQSEGTEGSEEKDSGCVARGELVPVPLEHDDAVVESEEERAEETWAEERVAPPMQARPRKRKQDPTTAPAVDLYCGATPGKRLQYRFATEGGGMEWFGGTVTKLLASWPGWVAVRFDDSELLEVELERGSEGAAWRWEPAPTTSEQRASDDLAPVVALGWVDEPGTTSTPGPAARIPPKAKRKRRSDSRFVGLCRRGNNWAVFIAHEGMIHYLGTFPEDREEDAARAFDAAARLYRGAAAHGGRSLSNGRYRLNFPTKKEIAAAAATLPRSI